MQDISKLAVDPRPDGKVASSAARTLHDLERGMRGEFADRTAIIIPETDRHRTHSQLCDDADAMRASIEQHADATRPIALALPNGLAAVACFLGITWSGRVAAPMNAALTADEFRFLLIDADVQAVIVPPGDSAAARTAREIGIACWEIDDDLRLHLPSTSQGGVAPLTGDTVAMFVHTSGTTSRPKGVPLTHTNLVASMAHICATYQLTERDVSLVVMPLFHVHGLIGVALSTLSSGGTLVVPEKFTAHRFWGDILKYGVTWYSAVPTIHQILLLCAEQEGVPKHGLRFIRSCSAALCPHVWQTLEEKFSTPVVQAYGMSEAAHQVASNPLPPARRRVGSVGPGSGVEIRILGAEGNDVPAGTSGEVVIRGTNVMHGYRENPTANRESFVDGWFRTGDVGLVDDDGYLTLLGRIKEIINRGGEKISPQQVDDVLLASPEIAQALSFGVPDEKYGEEIQAAVVLRENIDPAGAEERILSYCKAHLAAFMVPKKLFLLDALPKTATGKPRRLDMPRLLGQMDSP